MVGRDQREGSGFLCEGKKKKKVKYILAKGFAVIFREEERRKKTQTKPTPNQNPSPFV